MSTVLDAPAGAHRADWSETDELTSRSEPIDAPGAERTETASPQEHRHRPSAGTIFMGFVILALLIALGFLGWRHSALGAQLSDTQKTDAQFRRDMTVQMDRYEKAEKTTKDTITEINDGLESYEEQEKLMDALIAAALERERGHKIDLEKMNKWVDGVKVIVADHAAQVEELKKQNLTLFQMQEEKAKIMRRMQGEINAAWAATNSGAARRGPLMRLLGL